MIEEDTINRTMHIMDYVTEGGLDNVLAIGEITRFVQNVAWGSFEFPNKLGLATFDIPVYEMFHTVGDPINYYSNDRGDIICIFGKDFCTTLNIVQDNMGFLILAGAVIDRSGATVAIYAVDGMAQKKVH